MGRPPGNGGPAFRFMPEEVNEMENILQEHGNTLPAREFLVALAEKFSESPDRKGKPPVQMKQVWNWFQNRRYSIRAKTPKNPVKLNVVSMPRESPTTAISGLHSVAPQPVTPSAASPASLPAPIMGRPIPEHLYMEFEAKSGRDGAWYDVGTFLSHRYLDTGDPDVLVRFTGFGTEEDEWLNVRKSVRQRSLPCEASECVAVLPGDLILCFQEGKDQALYFDAHVLDAQRRRHDVRGCRCRFLVRYDHDQSEEIVQLKKICRRPETDYRLQQLHAANSAAVKGQQKATVLPSAVVPQNVAYSATDAASKQRHPDMAAVAHPAQVNIKTAATAVSTEHKSAGAHSNRSADNPGVLLTAPASSSGAAPGGYAAGP